METTNSKITLALVGKIGNGKSSTGNTLLGRGCFKKKSSTTACTFLTKPGFAIRGNLEIKVVDSPGFMDPDEENEILNVETQIPGIMSVCPEGIHALLLVLKYGNRCTTEDIKTVVKIKQIFGVNIIKDHGIIIFSHGENFDMDTEDREESDDMPNNFGTWCNQQTGPIRDLFKECGNRVVLFYNSHSKLYAEKKKIAVEQLLNIAVEMSKKGVYTNDKFKQCALERERFLSEHKLLVLNIEFQRESDLLSQDFYRFIKSNNLTEVDLNLLKNRVSDLLKRINSSSHSDSLGDLKESVQSIETSLKNINLQEPIAPQLHPLLKLLEAVRNPPMSVALGATILGCLLLASGVVLTVATGGAGAAVGAIVIESATTAAVIQTITATATRLGCTSLAAGVIAFVGKIINKFKQ
ncbi:GTPase IMAP family member 7-like [Physella acuta]|uniref:GTPase IMAP family member 7-like n=1 Tax=Physella acuta TaxID=109671 RepID=UPI0027DD7F48|nr:GTPase IMAP family member 7-like [Physella acuta]